MKNKSPRKTSRKPVAIGILLGMAATVTGIWAITTYWPQDPPDAMVLPVTQPPQALPETRKGFSILEGPPPGAEIPYKGTLVAWVRWTDDAGEHLATLSKEAEVLQALHYRRGNGSFELLSEHSSQPGSSAPEATAAFFRNSIRADDADGDGMGEAMFAYYVDEYPATGPKTLTVCIFTANRALSIQGNTWFAPAERTSALPITRLDEAMMAAPEPIRKAALELWDQAQFDLAAPPAYAGFFPHRRFAGASFSGDDPFWTLTILPQYLLLKLATEEKAAVIKYDSMLAEGSGLIIEGKGEIEAWNHAFRVTIAAEPLTTPQGEVFPYTVTIDWSDGTRLSGWGNLAPGPSIDLPKQDMP